MTPVKLLIVDDLRENLVALEALIRMEDRQIFEARSGDEALALLLEHEFALAILDVQMPGMNGLELASLMRGTEKTGRIPIIFVSAGAKELNYAFKGYETGAVDFLYKPLDPHAVRSKVAVFVEIHRQRQQLQEAQAELQRSIEMRDDFVSMVSHELRTPLNTLYLQTQLRRRVATGATLTPTQLTAVVERDEAQIRNMVRLIDDMLDVSRLRKGTLAIQPAAADLAVTVQRVVEAYADQSASVGCPIQLTSPPSVPGVWDEFRIEQVIANLLTNAMRYGGGKPVHVTVEATGQEATVVVRDQGIGIAPQDQARIFEQFERAVGKQLAPGLGLGLYITRQIVDAHGGRIGVQSSAGEGSMFTVRLPRRSLERV
ncbi:MAG: hybrid sensor histidine kinase/response regulator [Ramlibacter sp.]|nr:hybrid sensor histidine kinase/response regulator [Ramlibacter sp.]